MSFVADRQAPVSGQPCNGPFVLPTVLTQPRGILYPTTSDPRHDPASTQPPAMDIEVVTLVRPQFGGLAATRAALRAHPRNRFDHRGEHHRVVGVPGRNTGDQRYPVRVRNDVDLGSFLATVDRAAAGQRSPFFARTLAASRIAALQSRSPARPSRSRIARCNASNTPASAHTMNRRCAVGTLTPNDGGRCLQAQPLVNTNTTAVKTARSSAGAVPPP